MKCCRKCGDEHPVSEFYRDRKAKDGLFNWCKGCSRLHYEGNRERQLISAEKIRTRSRYGMTVKEKDDLLAGGCEVCGSNKKMCVDHDHVRNVVRGALCANCNASLGLAGDNPETLEALVRYVRSKATVERDPIPPPRDPRKLDVPVDLVIAGYAEGKTHEQIAKEFNCSRAYITYLLQREGVESHRKRRVDPAEVVRLYQSGLTQSQVGEELGCGQSYVWRILRYEGIEPRRGYRPRKAA